MKNIQLLFALLPFVVFGQNTVETGVYEYEGKNKTHRFLIDQNYLIETVFNKEPAEFILTRGGYYKETSKGIEVDFEFNSNYEKDSLKQIKYPNNIAWNKQEGSEQYLENKWLMGGRMSDEGISRRDTSMSRKTLKMLINGYFQWIAFDTKGYKFSGTGGGIYEAGHGKYIETIQYFSRDNSRVGAVLSFDFELLNEEWHHKGLSSKGSPIHEIWVKR